MGLGLALTLGGCGFDDGLIGGVRVTCDDDGDCVGGTTCAADRLCRDPEANVAPSIAIDTIERTIGSITIPVTVFDVESDPAVIDLEVKKHDGEWQAIAIDDNSVATGPEGVTKELRWRPQHEVMADDVFNEGVLLRATARTVGTNQRGEAVESSVFAYGNTAPVVSEIVVPEVVSGQQVPVVVKVSDAEGDDLDIVSAQVISVAFGSGGLTLPPADIVFENDGVGNDERGLLDIDVAPGIEKAIGLVWDSTQLPPPSPGEQAVMKIKVRDALGSTGESISRAFELKNASPPAP